MRAGSILKVELEDRSASGVLEVLRIAKTIKVKGVRKEVPLVDCELISGKGVYQLAVIVQKEIRIKFICSECNET